MTWTVQCCYAATAAPDLTAVSNAAVTYDPHNGSLQMAFEVEACTIEEATVTGLSAAARTTGLRPTRLSVQSTAEFVADHEHPAPLNLDLIGVTEIAGELGVSRQRAGKLAEDPDFPAPVLRTAAGRLYTRDSVKAFQQRWTAARNPRGGRRRRLHATASQVIGR
ncbi:hypothetical protein [Mycobacterium sp. 1245852.3]|uniref:hypothetical protein n=1 Tax=Mycobacterium sp. 1245852.3 TaxID=1856860 RepID=UPI0007FD5957|nr:hypothetical protein [Mycobacterium sp. 1245852.3]OBJ96822.1 hypothetical protein A9W96_19200 [Mycobacterium sp. 1245852.3]